MRASDLVGTRARRHTENLAGFLLAHRTAARRRGPVGAWSVRPLAPARRSPVEIGREQRTAVIVDRAEHAEQRRHVERIERCTGMWPLENSAAHRAAVVVELHLDKSRAHPRNLARRLLRALEKTGGREWSPAKQAEAEGTEHLTNATKRFETLQKRFRDRVGLVHGQMKGAEKDRVRAQFAAHEIGLLVATTVVEVGVDVPAATIMVIENAERFGLAQLHQLRGRIGRGSEASTCILLYGEPLGEMSKARLKVIRETTDGFRIAEEDLKLRGEGDVLGVRQSGLPGYRIARPEVHGQLIAQAREEALRVLKDDPRLKGERGEALRCLLYLFERDEAIPLIGAG